MSAKIIYRGPSSLYPSQTTQYHGGPPSSHPIPSGTKIQGGIPARVPTGLERKG